MKKNYTNFILGLGLLLFKPVYSYNLIQKTGDSASSIMSSMSKFEKNYPGAYLGLLCFSSGYVSYHVTSYLIKKYDPQRIFPERLRKAIGFKSSKTPL